MRVPVLNETLMLMVDGQTQPAICTDVFDGGWCWYIDAAFRKSMSHQFSAGEQSAIIWKEERGTADFVKYISEERWKVRFLISK